MGTKREMRAAMLVAAGALALTTLAGCGSSGSGTKPVAESTASGAVGAPVQTSDGSAAAPTAASTAGTASDTAAAGSSAKAFCDEFRGLSGLPGPNVGSSVPPGTLAMFDRMTKEAPAPVKAAMQSADTAVHGMSGKVDVAGLTALGKAMASITAWAADTKNCPVS